TLPSALLLILLALGFARDHSLLATGALHGLKVAAVAVVAQAVWGMARNFCTDLPRITIMVLAACIALFVPHAGGQAAFIVIAGLAGLALFTPEPGAARDSLAFPVGRRAGLACVLAFFTRLLGLPLLASWFPGRALGMID